MTLPARRQRRRSRRRRRWTRSRHRLRGVAGPSKPEQETTSRRITGTNDVVDLTTVCRCSAVVDDGNGSRNGRHSERNCKATRGGRQRRVIHVVIACITALPVTCLALLGLFLVISPLRQSSTGSDGDGRQQAADLKADYLLNTANTVTVQSSLQRATIDESGWTAFSKGSVNGSRYSIIDTAMTFYAGQERCQRLGGHLVHVNTLREQLFLEDFIGQMLQATEQRGGGGDGLSRMDDSVGFWIGAKRARGSHDGTCLYDQWRWIDFYGRPSGTVSGFTAFVPGKPDNYFDPEECLYMSTKEDKDDETRYLKWDDAPCDLNSVGGIKVVCEVELTPS